MITTSTTGMPKTTRVHGIVRSAGISTAISALPSTAFPATMQVDYVKVWQKA